MPFTAWRPVRLALALSVLVPAAASAQKLVTAALSSNLSLHQPATTKPPFVQVKGTTLGSAVNMPAKNVKLEGSLFLPDSAARVRAVLVVLRHGETEQHLLTGMNPYSVWHLAAESLSSALLHVRITPIREPAPGQPPPETAPDRNAAVGGAEGLLTLMGQLARESGHAELAEAPFLFWGWSSAAGFGPTFAMLHPDRTIAFTRYHSHLRNVPLNMETAKDIPALLFVGENDGAALAEDSAALFSRGRTLNAPWAYLLQPGVPHEIRAADIAAVNRLMQSWIAAVVNARVPSSGSRLVKLVEDSGWLGDNKTGDVTRARELSGPRHHLSWLPDEQTALAWQSLIRAAK